MRWDIISYREIDSTNEEVRRCAQSGKPEGCVIVAAQQTAGRGRRGRSWESKDEGNLYFSILLRPKLSPERAPMLTLVMAYSVAKVLREQRKLEAGIKWPNDLVFSRKKACGILTEMHLQDRRIEDVILGVGINVNQREFSAELSKTATSLALEAGVSFDRDLLLRDVLNEFETQYERFLETQNLSFLQKEYNELLVNRNQIVTVLEPGREYQGIALGVNECGELFVQKEDGEVETVYAGEVSVRGIFGYI